MKVDRVVIIGEDAIQFSGELSQEETDLVVGVGLNYLIRAGMFPRITESLAAAQKAEEAATGYAFPQEMDKND